MDGTDGEAPCGPRRVSEATAGSCRVHGGRDPLTGRKRYVERTCRGTKREAQRELAALVTQSIGKAYRPR